MGSGAAAVLAPPLPLWLAEKHSHDAREVVLLPPPPGAGAVADTSWDGIATRYMLMGMRVVSTVQDP